MPQNHILIQSAEGTPMESHPYTKPRGVGPVTTQLTPGAKPDLKKVARDIFRETLAGIDIFEAMRSKVALKGSHLSITGIEPGASSIAVDLAAYNRVRLVALGKASIEMARG